MKKDNYKNNNKTKRQLNALLLLFEKARGIKEQKDLATHLSISTSGVTRYEQGKYKITAQLFFRLCHLYAIDPADIFTKAVLLSKNMSEKPFHTITDKEDIIKKQVQALVDQAIIMRGKTPRITIAKILDVNPSSMKRIEQGDYNGGFKMSISRFLTLCHTYEVDPVLNFKAAMNSIKQQSL